MIDSYPVGDIHLYRVFVPLHTAIIKYDAARVPAASMTLPARQTISMLNGCLRELERNYTRLQRWSKDDRLRILKHFAFTIFAPAGRADRAVKAVEQLEELAFFDNWANWSKEDLADIIKPNVRFHNQKASRLCSSLAAIETLHKLDICKDPNRPTKANIQETHKWLYNNVSGLGLKATAHLMRNIGFSSDHFAYPIIDVHIIKMLGVFKCEHEPYKNAEESFQRISTVLGIPVIFLDAYIWCLYSGNWNTSEADFSNF